MSESGYTVLNQTEDTVTVQSGSTVYQIDKASFEAIKGVLTVENANVILGTMASANARTAKVFDAEKAAKEALRAEKAKALAEFEQVLTGWNWSANVCSFAAQVQGLRIEQGQVEEMPFSLSLEGYSKNSPSKSCEVGQYRFTYFKGIPSLVVGLNGPLPRAMVVQQEIEAALHTFRTACADEIDVPAVLKTENTSKDFDVSEDGSIVYNVKINVRSGGSGGGKRRKVKELSTGVVYDSKTSHGNAFNTNGTKYPHKISEARILAGKAEYVS